MTTSAIKDPGSFRDPSGYIVKRGNRIFRFLSREAYLTIKSLEKSGLLKDLELKEDIVATKTDVPEGDYTSLIEPENSFVTNAVEHDLIPFITYPSEWTKSMLCDAALHTLELERKLVRKGHTLKDATAYNIQFMKSNPIHIDVPSIQPLDSSIWTACGQFYRMYLYPLILNELLGYSTKSYFLTNIQGLSTEEVYRLLGVRRSCHPFALVDVLVPIVLQKIWGERPIKSPVLSNPSKESTKNISFSVTRLLKLIRKIRNRQSDKNSYWVQYQSKNTYNSAEVDQKKSFLENFLQKEKLNSIIDLGCNIGTFSKLALKYVPEVISVDSDHECIDTFYQEAKEQRLNLTLLWMDLLNPTPSMGFRGIERESFFHRIRSDGVIAYALIHHLVAAFQLPYDQVRDFLLELTNRYVLVEYINPKDPQFKSLKGQRKFPDDLYSEEIFLNIFTQKATLIKSEKINQYRSLHLFLKQK